MPTPTTRRACATSRVSMTNGECGDVKLGIRRGSETLQITAKRLPAKDMAAISRTHDLPGETFRLLSPDVAYLKLSSVKAADIDHYLESASKTKGLIIDIRNYPVGVRRLLAR